MRRLTRPAKKKQHYHKRKPVNTWPAGRHKEPTIVQDRALCYQQPRPANGNDRRFRDLTKVQAKRLFFRLPLDRINWLTSSFLIGTAVLTLTALPLYLWFFGLDWFQVVLFFVMLSAIGFSVTLGYHRL